MFLPKPNGQIGVLNTQLLCFFVCLCVCLIKSTQIDTKQSFYGHLVLGIWLKGIKGGDKKLIIWFAGAFV
jgi:hypothetical protein